MKLNKFQKGFIFPVVILIGVLANGIRTSTFLTHLSVVGIILLLFIPYILLSKHLIRSKGLIKCKALWGLNTFFILNWFIMSWLFFRENSQPTFLRFYSGLISKTDGFTVVVFAGMVLCLGMINFIIFNFQKQVCEK
jgi:hypothetical protein